MKTAPNRSKGGFGKPSFKDKRASFLKRSREATTEVLRTRDVLLANISKSIVEINKATNLMNERLEELYGLYFPELKIEDKEKYVKLITVIDKKNPDMKELSKLMGSGGANNIANSAKNSMGADMSAEDLAEIQVFAQKMVELYDMRSRMEKYQGKLARELCPNICEVAGPDVAAKLVAHVGSLQRLALLPSSTIQVLGAERALFKHLKNKRIAPPKHGIIFQHVSISSSPKKVRGKVARLLANKICSASKADYFTKNSIGPQLKKEFDDHFKHIMDEYQRMKAKTGKPDEKEE